MSTIIPKRVKRTKVLSTKVIERDNRFFHVMVDRYFDNGIIPQAKTSTLLRLLIKRFLRRDCPEYNKRHLAVINKRLISCIQPQKVILVLPLIHSKRQITLQGHQQQTVLL